MYQNATSSNQLDAIYMILFNDKSHDIQNLAFEISAAQNKMAPKTKDTNDKILFIKRHTFCQKYVNTQMH